MVKKPDILLCDELTGALDTKSSKDVLQRVQKMNDTYKTTVVIITHYNDQFPGRNGLVKISNKIKSFYSFLKIGDGATVIKNNGGIGDGEALSHEDESNAETTGEQTTTPSETAKSTETTQPINAAEVDETGKETVYSNQYIILLDNRLMEQYTNVYITIRHTDYRKIHSCCMVASFSSPRL